LIYTANFIKFFIERSSFGAPEEEEREEATEIRNGAFDF